MITTTYCSELDVKGAYSKIFGKLFSLKLVDIVTFPTVSNINIVFSNCLQTRYTFAIFFTMDDVLEGKLAISSSFKKNHFPKISDQAPLIMYGNSKVLIAIAV